MKSVLTNRWVQRGIAVLLIGCLFASVDAHSLVDSLSNLTWGRAAFLLYLSVVLIFISALKWKIFLEGFAGRVSLARLNALYYIGYFVNLILPSHVGGDAVRSWYAGKSVGQHEAAAGTILERLLGLVAMLGLALVSMWFVPRLPWETKAAVALMSAGLGVVIVTALSPRIFALIERIPRTAGVVSHLRKIQGALRGALARRGVLWQALGLSLLYHSITVVNTLAAAAAVGWFDAPARELFVVLPIILLVGSLPITPSGLGLQEGAFMYFLTGLGATPAQALGVGVVLRAKSYILALVGGIVWLTVRREKAGAPMPAFDA